MTKRILTILLLAVFVTASLSTSALAEKRTHFKLAWSIYVGWMPWAEADAQGIVKKWADKYGIEIEVVQFNDYVESINQYTAGAFDAVTATNMDTLAIPCVGGIDTTALLIGDFSNGNDALIMKGDGKLADIKGKPVNLVELSVSHYLLARALDSVDLRERDISVINTSDADMIAAFSTPDVEAVVTWNPLVAEILDMPEANKLFDSSLIPGEIIDLTVVNTKTIEENPEFAKALTGAWYEFMALMSSDSPAGKAARAEMGKASGTDLAGYDMQLAKTKMFFDAKDAVSFGQSSELAMTMDNVRNFLFEHGLLGNGAPSPDVVGIAFPDGSTLGDPDNVTFRFDTSYMDMAAANNL
jgi:NitT/TauT family transport system substrate-binding protein